MKKLLALLATAFLALPTLSSADAPPSTDDQRTYSEEEIREGEKKLRRMIKEQPENKELLEINLRTPEGLKKARAFKEKLQQEERKREVVKKFPELQGVDLESPEGKEKLLDLAKKSYAADVESMSLRVSQRWAQRRAVIHFELSQDLGMTQDEFDAIEPLLVRIENLRRQNTMVCQSDYEFTDYDNSAEYRNPYIKLPLLLGVAQLEPTVQEIQDASTALHALVGDKQANATELASVIARLCKARQHFYAVYTKAEDELRAVLTPLQEAVLIAKGTLR